MFTLAAATVATTIDASRVSQESAKPIDHTIQSGPPFLIAYTKPSASPEQMIDEALAITAHSAHLSRRRATGFSQDTLGISPPEWLPPTSRISSPMPSRISSRVSSISSGVALTSAPRGWLRHPLPDNSIDPLREGKGSLAMAILSEMSRETAHDGSESPAKSGRADKGPGSTPESSHGARGFLTNAGRVACELTLLRPRVFLGRRGLGNRDLRRGGVQLLAEL